MTDKIRTYVVALLFSAVTADQALAFFQFTPNPGNSGPAGVPELDGPGGAAAIALVVSVAFVLFNRSKNH